MDGDTLYSIGELARRTGLTVKTVRFYSDRGIVAPTDRSPAGYRLYGIDAVARLDLVRTLRELGLDLATIRKVVDRELSLPEVAVAHAEALAVQIRVLRLRHAVMTAVAERGATPEETELMHRLAQLSEHERRRLIGEFLDAVFGGLDAAAPALAGVMRSMTPELPDNPEAEQVQAWVELAELSLDPGFRVSMRKMAEEQAAEQARSDTSVPIRDIAVAVRDQAARPSPLASSRPHPRPIRSSRRSRRTTPSFSAAPTTVSSATGWRPGWRASTTPAGSDISSCSRWSTGGRHLRAWLPSSTGPSRLCVSGRRGARVPEIQGTTQRPHRSSPAGALLC